MLRSTELDTFGMKNTIYCDLLCHVKWEGGNLSIEGEEFRGDWMTKHLHGKPVVLALENTLKTMNVQVISCKTL